MASSIQLPPVVDVNDFLTEQDPEYDWLIPDRLERGDRLILTGREGQGKSTLLRQIAVCCAMGLDPFSQVEITPLRVGLLDLENSRKHTRREVRRIKQGLAIDPEFLWIGCYPGGLNLASIDQQAALAELLQPLDLDMLIMGPMYKMAPGLETEEASSKLAQYLDKLRTGLDCAIVMESHQPHESILKEKRFRPERPFGSSLWLRWPEFGICLEDDGTLRHWRGARDEREWPAKLKWGEAFPWELDVKRCLRCGDVLQGKQESYCSEACRQAYKQQRRREMLKNRDFI